MFPNKYLAAADLRGKDVTLTIFALKSETLKTSDGDEPKWTMHFSEMQSRAPAERKRLVLNKTNAKTIAKLLGTETDDWLGQRITLFGTTCQAFGETVECIRVRPQRPRQVHAAPAHDPVPEREPGDDWDEDPTIGGVG
jgi:hypothetical protein